MTGMNDGLRVIPLEEVPAQMGVAVAADQPRTFHDVFGFDPTSVTLMEVEQKIVDLVLAKLVNVVTASNNKVQELMKGVKESSEVPELLRLRVALGEELKRYFAAEDQCKEARALASKAGFKV